MEVFLDKVGMRGHSPRKMRKTPPNPFCPSTRLFSHKSPMAWQAAIDAEESHVLPMNRTPFCYLPSNLPLWISLACHGHVGKYCYGGVLAAKVSGVSFCRMAGEVAEGVKRSVRYR